jgi:hypothetical protein
MNFIEHIKRNRSRYYLILICAFVLLLSTKGITDESTIAMNGDMPKYLMNGAFFYDLIRDLSFKDPLGYAYRYFARYPALSLGHHPLLLSVAEVPFYAIFGISVFSAKLTIVFFMFIGVTAWFKLVRNVYDETAAVLSSLLLVTTPFIAEYSRMVMSEIPTLSLIMVTTYFFYQYCETSERKYVFASAVTLSLSIYSKHIAIFLIPVLLLYLVIRRGVRGLIKKEIIIASLVAAVLLVPFFYITLKFSHANLSFVSKSISLKSAPFISPLSERLTYYLNTLWKNHLTLPVFILSLIAIPLSIFRRDKRTIIFFLWMIIFYLVTVSLGFQVPRYAIYWIPVFCFFAATTIDLFRNFLWKIFIVSVFVVIIGYQFIATFRAKPNFTVGYEEAARYLIENKKGEMVLYSGIYDTGYFIFFIRKHNPDNDLIVLRADKILATSKMDRIVEEKIRKREEIYDILNRYGISYIVLEDTKSKSRSIEWLREEVRSDKFTLHKKFTIQSSNSKVDKIPLTIYEYKEYTAPYKGQVLKMNIPLMGDSIEVPIKDLLNNAE